MALVKCQFCNIKREKDKMDCETTESPTTGKKSNKYYCPECKKLLKSRNEALEKFYSYTGSLLLQNQVYTAFKKMKDKGLNEHDILCVMDYIIENKHVLNYPMGMLYYIDRAMKDKRIKEQQRKSKEKILQSKTKPITIIKDIPKEPKQVDEMDISDFLDEEE